MPNHLVEKELCEKIEELRAIIKTKDEQLIEKDKLIGIYSSAMARAYSELELIKSMLSDIVTGRNLDDGK